MAFKKTLSLLSFALCFSLAFTACSAPMTSNGSATNATGLSTEERNDSTFNPIYMGSDTDYRGNPLKIVTGKNGAVQNKDMLDHHAPMKTGLIKVTDQVYVSTGRSLSNTVFIIGDKGAIAIDSSESNEISAARLAEFRKVCDKPITDIIYSHHHYTKGTAGLLTSDEMKSVNIWAHERNTEIVGKAYGEISSTYFRRELIHHGVPVPAEGEDGYTGGGLGAYFIDPSIKGSTLGYMPPTKAVSGTEPTEVTIPV